MRVSPYRVNCEITKDRGVHVKRGTFVVEDAQLGDLTCNGRDLSGTVAALDTQEDDEALARSAGTLPRRGGLADGCVGVAGGTHVTRRDLSGRPSPRLVTSRTSRTNRKREAADDLAVDANLTRSRPLDDGAHQRAPRAEPRPPKPVDPPRWPASRERSAPGRVCGDTEDLPWMGTISSWAAATPSMVEDGAHGHGAGDQREGDRPLVRVAGRGGDDADLASTHLDGRAGRGQVAARAVQLQVR